MTCCAFPLTGGYSNLFIQPYIYLLSLHHTVDSEECCCVKKIYAGGDQSFAHYVTANVSCHP